MEEFILDFKLSKCESLLKKFQRLMREEEKIGEDLRLTVCLAIKILNRKLIDINDLID